MKKVQYEKKVESTDKEAEIAMKMKWDGQEQIGTRG